MKRFALILLIPVALMLSSCGVSNLQVYNRIDSAEKTITIPPGNYLLVGALKQQLYKSGWKLVVDKGPIRTTGTMGKETDIKAGGTFRTRYRLELTQQQFDNCVHSPAVNYDLSLIDNVSGEEVITQNGSDCETQVVEKFMLAVRNAEN